LGVWVTSCCGEQRGLVAGNVRVGYYRQKRSLQQAVAEIGRYMVNDELIGDALTDTFTRQSLAPETHA
jgi:hypothetical protein